jgi:hypothetical protein
MKLLIIGNFHKKNMIGLNLIIKELNIEFKYGNINEINNFDIIYSPNIPINVSSYSNKKFIFGPHFSVFPDNKLKSINNIYNNCIYIQPSVWAVNVWYNFQLPNISLKKFPFPVEINKFKPKEISLKEEVFIYFKRRKLSELRFVQKFLDNKNIKYKIFDYVSGYKESDYLNCLQNAKYGIIIDAHESQGFAIEEALSCNVPLLVWNVKDMTQEEGGRYPNFHCTSIPYWNNNCGEFFYNKSEFETSYSNFIDKLKTYNPRKYIIDNLSPHVCAKSFLELINSIKILNK